MAFCPPSVIQGAPSGPMTTPWGAAPLPRSISLNEPSRGSSRPSVPLRWPQNQIVPSGAGATSRDPMPLATGKYFTRNGLSWARAPRKSAGVAKIAAEERLRNWRRFIALPRLYEEEGLDAKINLVIGKGQHSPVTWD